MDKTGYSSPHPFGYSSKKTDIVCFIWPTHHPFVVLRGGGSTHHPFGYSSKKWYCLPFQPHIFLWPQLRCVLKENGFGCFYLGWVKHNSPALPPQFDFLHRFHYNWSERQAGGIPIHN